MEACDWFDLNLATPLFEIRTWETRFMSSCVALALPTTSPSPNLLPRQAQAEYLAAAVSLSSPYLSFLSNYTLFVSRRCRSFLLVALCAVPHFLLLNSPLCCDSDKPHSFYHRDLLSSKLQPISNQTHGQFAARPGVNLPIISTKRSRLRSDLDN